MPQQKTYSRSLKDVLKSSGSWFFFGNAALNGQTHPAVSFAYAALFTTQRIASHYLEARVSGRVLPFLLGPQGPLLLNSVVTGAVGVAASVYGPPELAHACLDFGIANLFQSLIFGGAITFSDTKAGAFFKNASLAGCEIFILDALRKVAENAGFTPKVAFFMAAPGVGFALLRSFAPGRLPSSLAYVDMMGMAAATGVEAVSTGNYLNAVSRVFAAGAFSRLAVARAKTEGKSTVFEVERWVPRLYAKIRAASPAAG